MSGSVNKGRLEPCKNTLSGVKNVYFWKWQSYNLSQITGVRGVSLTAYPSTTVFKYPAVSDANTYDENLGEDNAYDQTLSVTLKKIDLEYNQELSNYQNIILGVIVEDYNGLFRLMGAFNGVELADLNVGIGSGRADFNGYKLTLEAQERFKAPLFTSLVAVGFFVDQSGINNTVSIGNVSSFITSAADMAARCSLLESQIFDFNIDGADITFKTYTDYNLNVDAFRSTSILYYRDYNHLINLNSGGEFRSSSIIDFIGVNTLIIGNGTFLLSNLETFTAPNCNTLLSTTFRGSNIVIANLPKVTFIQSFTTVTSGNFTDCTFLELINIPLCTILGNTDGSTNEFIFDNIKTGCVINANVFLQTNNSGNSDENLVYAINTNSAIVNYI
jgi:hypothetical protein